MKLVIVVNIVILVPNSNFIPRLVSLAGRNTPTSSLFLSFQIYKSTKCNDVSVTGYCPRGPFCAFAHIERTYTASPLVSQSENTFVLVFFVEELKSYRDFDLHYTSELPLSSFIPIPEDKEVDAVNVSPSVP